MIRQCCTYFGLTLVAMAVLRDVPATFAQVPTIDRTIRFADATKAAGLIEPLAGIMGHGAAAGDFDGDGLIDIYVGGFCDRPNSEYAPANGPVPNRLLRNLGQGKFEVVHLPPVEFYGRTSGAVFADLDNNGTLELYSANNAKGRAGRGEEPQASAPLLRSKLFRNDGGKLIDISAASGACPDELLTARNIGVFDYDADGLLDLLVVEDRFRRPPSRTTLFRNQGGMRFLDVTKAAGLPEDMFGLGLAVADLNGDRRPDFFVPHSNRMFLSNGDGTYREPAELRELFAWKPIDGEDWPCGAHFGDLNNDGLLDLVLSIHFERARNRVYINEGLNSGVPQFRDVTQEVGLGETVPIKCPHVEIQDFDNDGLPDIYMSAAWLDSDGNVTPLVYRNVGIRGSLPRFAPPREIKGPMVYYPAGPSADYDNDGRVDLFLVNWFQGNHCRLMLNDSPPRHWLNVSVVGKRINRMGIGSQVRVYKAGQIGQPKGLLGFQELTMGYGYASGQPALCHFGLGDETTIDVRVTLPNGAVIEKTNVAADQSLVIEES
jgi:hypothetical protein